MVVNLSQDGCGVGLHTGPEYIHLSVGESTSSDVDEAHCRHSPDQDHT